MADFGQGDEVISKPKSSWGHDDEVVSTKQTSVEGAGGAAFGVYPRPGMEPGKPTPTVSALGAFGASAAEGIAATPGVLLGARGGAALMPPVAPVLGPLSKPVGAIAGGIVGGIAASKVIETTEQFADQIFGTNITGIRQQQQEQYPYTSLAGQVVGGAVNPLMRPGLPSSAVQGAVGSGIMTVVGATQRAIQGGDPFDPVAMTIDATTGAFTKPTKLGERLLGQAAAPIDMSAGKKPGVTSNVNPPPGISKEEFIAGLEKKKQEKLSKVPLVETAIRNKVTGEITRLGPKHPEDVKEATKDTHEQGFVDEQGNFLNRKEAADRAVTAGQIETKTYTTKEISEPSKTVESINKELDVLKKRLASAEQTDAYDTAQQTRKSIKALEQKLKIVEQYGPTEAKYKDVTKTGPKIERPEEGLHSGDLRAAGDKRFEIDSNKPVKFANLNKPTSEEFHNHIQGSETLGEAIDKILAVKDLGGLGQRLLLKSLRKSNFISDAKLELVKDVLKYTDKNGKEQDALGLYHGGSDHRVQLGKNSNIKELLHEAMHAGTKKLLDDKTSNAAIAMHKLFNKYQQEHITKYEENLDRFKLENPNATIEQLNKFKEDNDPYGFENVHEFVSEAFTNKDFQELLSKIDVRERKNNVLSNLWDSFKEVIRLNLGVPNEAISAFDDVINLGSALVEESKSFKRDNDGTITVSPSRLSQEVHDDLKREGIAVAHTSPHKFDKFDWIKNHLKGEGAMVKGAGTYMSQGDRVNEYYLAMSKSKVLDAWLNKPENKQEKFKYDSLQSKIDNLHNELVRLGDKLIDFENKEEELNLDIQRAKYYANQSFENWIKDNDIEKELFNPESLKQSFIESINVSKQELIKLEKQKEEFDKNNKNKIEELKKQHDTIVDEYDKTDNDFKSYVKKISPKVPTYHSTIEAKPEEFLDWNSTTQSKIVSDAFKKLGIEVNDLEEDLKSLSKEEFEILNVTDLNKWRGNFEEDGEISIGLIADPTEGSFATYKIKVEEAQYDENGNFKVNKYLFPTTGEITTSLQKAIQRVQEYVHQEYVGGKQQTGEELYRQLSDKFKPKGAERGNLLSSEAQLLGDVKASIALAELGVVGNVHDAASGREKKYRNYVVFNDSRIKQNLVTLASKSVKDAAEKVDVRSIPNEETPVDRTKTSPRDVKDEQEFNEIAQEIYEKHGEVEAVEFFRGWEEFKKTWAEPVKEVEKFVGININNKLANERIVHNNTADIKELAGKDVNLEQLSFDIDKGVPLEGKAKEIATKFRTLMDELGKRALENNVIKGWHENYVARNIVTEGAAPPGAVEEFMRDAFGYGEKASGDGTKTTTKYGQPRRLKSREDLVNHIQGINSWLESKGLDYRFKLKTDNLAEIYKDYALSVEKAIENKNLIDNIKQIRNVNGESLIKPISGPEDLPYGWKQIDHPDLAGYAIHPDLVPALKFVFDSGPGLTMQALGTISQAVKRINVIGSFFHAKSLMEVLSSSRIPLWTPVKEAIVLPLVEKGVKALTGKDLQLSAISKAVEQYKKGGLGDNVDLWIKSNMRLEMPEDVARGILSSTGKLADTLISKYGPKTRVLESSLSTVEKYTLGMFDKYTWDYLHTGGKIMVADAYLEKARLQAAKEGKPFDEMAARKEIASFVNDSFGGLNWFDAARRTEGEFAKRMAMAAYSPEGRRALQVALFAPDWTISTIRAFTSALPKGLNPTKWQPVEGIKGMMVPTTKADYARLYQFKTALVYFTLINAINNMTAGRDLWDNKDPTRIEFSDGTSMQAMKHAMEPYHWIADPDKTLSNKMGFIPKALIIGFGGVEYASPTAPKLVDLSGLGRLKAAVSTALPFQLQAGASAPEGEGAKRALLGTAGFPIYGADADTKKVQRAERELATKENAWKYRDNEIKKGRMQWTPKHDQEKRALDKRRQKLNKETE